MKKTAQSNFTLNPWVKNILTILGLFIIIALAWYFRTILAYVAISAVLALVGRPATDFLSSLGYKRFKFPRSLAAALTILLIFGLIFLFFRIFIPVILKQAKELSTIDYSQWMAQFQVPLQKLQDAWQSLNGGKSSISIQTFLLEKINPLTSVNFLSNFITLLTGFLGNLFIALFSITFITFFFLKEEKLFTNMLLVLVPSKKEKALRRAIDSINHLLIRYFIGLATEVTFIIILVTLGMMLVGIKFQNAMVIGLFAGLVNVIPYVGPLIGTSFGLLLGMVTHLHEGSGMFTLILLMLAVFAVVHLIDNLVFQPWIYSSSVHAHPLEIFLVILMAGSLWGIAGMIVAIPTYTVSRVLAREFLYNLKLVKKLTKKMNV